MEDNKMKLTKWIFLVFGVSVVLILTLMLLNGSGQIKLTESSLSFMDKLMMFMYGLVNLVMGYWFADRNKQEAVDTAVRTTVQAMQNQP